MWWDPPTLSPFVWLNAYSPWGLTNLMSTKIRLYLCLMPIVGRRKSADTGRDPGIASPPFSVDAPPSRTAARAPSLQSLGSASDTSSSLATYGATNTRAPLPPPVARDRVAATGESSRPSVDPAAAGATATRGPAGEAATVIVPFTEMEEPRPEGPTPQSFRSPRRVR